MRSKSVKLRTDHGPCRAEPCLACAAERYLTPHDFLIVQFYSAVRDQVVNLTPMGLQDGGFFFAPRIEAWVAVLDLWGVLGEARRDLIEAARYLHELVAERERVRGVHQLPLSELKPPES